MRNHADFFAILLLAAAFAAPLEIRLDGRRIEHRLQRAEDRMELKLRRIEVRRENVHRFMGCKLERFL